MFLLLSRLTKCLARHRGAAIKTFCTSASHINTVDSLQRFLDISKVKAEYIILKHPSVCQYDRNHLQQVVDTIQELGIKKQDLAEQPVIFTSLPITLKYRYKVLNECGFHNITADTLSKYLTLVRKRSVAELKDAGLILSSTAVRTRLADIFTQWPTSRSCHALGIDENKCSLQDIRTKVLQRYLELVIDLSENEFEQSMKRYVRIRHRPFECINETLMLLLHDILMPNEKIKANFFLIHADPENMKQLLYELREIGGVSIKEIMKMRPKLCTTNYQSIVAIQKILNEHGVKREAQVRCFDIFTLSPETVRERMDTVKSIPEFEALKDHPRLLRIVHYEKKALKRLETLHQTNKQCFSLNILSGSSNHYKVYEKAPGDRTKGMDLLHGIATDLGPTYTHSKVRECLKRNPFWLNVPLKHAKFICKQLDLHFSSDEIFENCPIVLYPWSKIKLLIEIFLENKKFNQTSDLSELNTFLEHLDKSKLTKSQVLSLILYFMEKEHYFSGNGVWIEDKLNQINTSDEEEHRKSGHQSHQSVIN